METVNIIPNYKIYHVTKYTGYTLINFGLMDHVFVSYLKLDLFISSPIYC